MAQATIVCLVILGLVLSSLAFPGQDGLNIRRQTQTTKEAPGGPSNSEIGHHDDPSHAQGAQCDPEIEPSSPGVRCVDGKLVHAGGKQEPRLPRSKRAVGRHTDKICMKRCKIGWWWKKHCRTDCTTVYVQNQEPFIICPTIASTIYIKDGEVDTVVHWSSAHAYDERDGEITTRQTNGRHPGSRLSAGMYTVTYMATDSNGASSTCSKLFRVEAPKCNTFTYLGNGDLFCSNGRYVTSVCSFQCQTGYQLIGSPSSTCTPSQEWSHAWPRCQITSCGEPINVTNGQWSSNTHVYGSRSSLTCDPGYKVKGPTIILCTSSGKWTEPGICVDSKPPNITCPDDFQVLAGPKMAATKVTWDMSTASDNSDGPVSLTCSQLNGSLFRPGQWQVGYTAQDANLNRARCRFGINVTVLRCDDLQTPPNAYPVACSHENAYGSDCTFNCVAGFNLEGAARLSCRENRQWDAKPPQCKRVTCGSPPSVGAHGFYNCSEGSQFEDSCHLSCVPGYQAVSPLTVTCQASQTWARLGSCQDLEPPTFPDGCPNVHHFAAPVRQPTFVSYSLPLTLDNSGVEVNVKAIPGPGSEFPVGSTNVTVVAEDEAGNSKTCSFSVEVTERACQDPYSSKLGKDDMLMDFDCPDDFVLGAVCTLSCRDGNLVQGGVQFIQCSLGANQTLEWTYYGDSKPYCEGHVCPKVQRPTHGSVSCQDTVGNEVCAVLCNANFSYPSTYGLHDFFYCSKRRGKWNPFQIKEDLCKPGRPPVNLEVVTDIHYPVGACSNSTDQIKGHFIQLVQNASLLQSCQGNACSMVNVSVQCGASVKGDIESKNETELSTLKVSFTVAMDYKGEGDAQETNRFYTIVRDKLNGDFQEGVENGDLDLPGIDQTGTPSYGTGFYNFNCPLLAVFSGTSGVCVPCGPGFQYNEKRKDCSICPLGSFQPLDRSDRCISCPVGYSTLQAGSVSTDSCVLVCPKGSYSRTGMKPCKTCPRGTYQPRTGQTSCVTCDYGMVTHSKGSGSFDDCQFSDVTLSQNQTGSRLPKAFTRLQTVSTVWWVKVPSRESRPVTTFGLTEGEGHGASIGCVGYKVYIHQDTGAFNWNFRQWYHLALVAGTEGVIKLYVDGHLTDSSNTTGFAMCGEEERFQFEPGSIQQVTISGLQMSQEELTQERVKDITSSCHSRLPGNLLTKNDVIDTLPSYSTCDDNDGCATVPCGMSGNCTDTAAGFECECVELWSGEKCQIAPDFCDAHQCQNGATCTNQPDERTYSCVCPADFQGRHCVEPIVNGNWSRWGAWSDCSQTCGGGESSRTRMCNNPIPGPGGKPCQGHNEEAQECQSQPCPVDGGLGPWSEWICPVTCGSGQASRSRKCDSPAPMHDGQECQGQTEQLRECPGLEPCPVDGGFGDWTEWSACSLACGGGTSQRTRPCDRPAPLFGGRECGPGEAVETKSCNEQVCKTCKDLSMSPTYQWINCTKTGERKTCIIYCKRGYELDDNTYFCGPDTGFDWSLVSEYNPEGILPDCKKMQLPEYQEFQSIIDFYGQTIMDDDVHSISDQVSENARKRMQCVFCEVHVVALFEQASRRVKRSDVSDKIQVFLEVKQTLNLSSVDLTKASDSELMQIGTTLGNFHDGLANVLNETEEVFSVTVGNVTLAPDMSSMQVNVTAGCQEGLVEEAGVCVACAPGTMLAEDECQLCPKGTFQDREKQTECKGCPKGTSTSGLGSKSPSDCVSNPVKFQPAYPVSYPEARVAQMEDKEEGPDTWVLAVAGLVGVALAVVLVVVVVRVKGRCSHFGQYCVQEPTKVEMEGGEFGEIEEVAMQGGKEEGTENKEWEEKDEGEEGIDEKTVMEDGDEKEEEDEI